MALNHPSHGIGVSMVCRMKVTPVTSETDHAYDVSLYVLKLIIGVRLLGFSCRRCLVSASTTSGPSAPNTAFSSSIPQVPPSTGHAVYASNPELSSTSSMPSLPPAVPKTTPGGLAKPLQDDHQPMPRIPVPAPTLETIDRYTLFKGRIP